MSDFLKLSMTLQIKHALKQYCLHFFRLLVRYLETFPTLLWQLIMANLALNSQANMVSWWKRFKKKQIFFNNLSKKMAIPSLYCLLSPYLMPLLWSSIAYLPFPIKQRDTSKMNTTHNSLSLWNATPGKNQNEHILNSPTHTLRLH